MPTVLQLKSMPKVRHINPWAFVIACCLIATVVGVLLYTLTAASPVKQKASSLPPTPLEAENERRWYQAIPNGAVHSSAAVVNPSSEFKLPLSREAAAALKAAMDSPIKAAVDDVSLQEMQSKEMRSPFEQGSSSNPTETNPLTENDHLLNKLAQEVDADVLHASLKQPISPYVLQAGTLLPATLVGSLNSDLPGQLSALVNQNVYDSINGHYLLVPQGSKLILTYDANVAYGQKRLLVVVKRLIFPDGRSLDLNNMPAVDRIGQAGLHDEIDNHYVRLFGSAAMLGAITGGFQLSHAPSSSGNMTVATPSFSETLGNAMGDEMGQVAIGMMNKNLNLAPQLIIRPGYPFNVQVTQDLVFPGPYLF